MSSVRCVGDVGSAATHYGVFVVTRVGVSEGVRLRVRTVMPTLLAMTGDVAWSGRCMRFNDREAVCELIGGLTEEVEVPVVAGGEGDVVVEGRVERNDDVTMNESGDDEWDDAVTVRGEYGAAVVPLSRPLN